MKLNITGRNLTVTQGLREAAEKKLGKLGKFFSDDTTCYVTFSHQKDNQIIEVTIPVRGRVIRAEQASADMYQSIDLVIDVIERQIRRYKKKIIDKKQSSASFTDFFIEEPENLEEPEIKIVRTKQVDLKPMDPEEACLQMELIGHDFFVFQNAENDRVCVVYKRHGGSYGLIEPEG